jgi:carboxyl-terminal processing protease
VPPGASAQPPAAAPARDAKAPARRYEWGSSDDYQLQQAMNRLKGKPVEVAKPKPDSVANVVPPR